MNLFPKCDVTKLVLHHVQRATVVPLRLRYRGEHGRVVFQHEPN